MLVLILFMSFTSAAAWALFGQAVREVIEDETRRVWFNRIMGLALAASIWPLFLTGLPKP